MSTIAHRLKWLAIDCNGQPFKLGASVAAGSPGDTVTLTFVDKLTTSGTDVPTITSSYYLPITIDADHPGLVEVFWITAYTSGATTATAIRGQEGSQAVPHSNGATCSNGPTTYDIKASFDAPWAGDTLAGGPFDYEFNGRGLTTLPAGWSWHNQGGATYQEQNGVGRIEVQEASAWNLRGIERLLPTASSFIVYAKINPIVAFNAGNPGPYPQQVPSIFGDGVIDGATGDLQSATAGFDASDVGCFVLGKDIPNGTFIQAFVSATEVTLSQATTAATATEHFQIVGRNQSISQGQGSNLFHCGLYLRQAGGGAPPGRLGFGFHWGPDGSGTFPNITYSQVEIVLFDTDAFPFATAARVGIADMRDSVYLALRKNSATSWDLFAGNSGTTQFFVGNVDPTAYGTSVGFAADDFTADTVGAYIANNTGNVAGIDISFFRIR